MAFYVTIDCDHTVWIGKYQMISLFAHPVKHVEGWREAAFISWNKYCICAGHNAKCWEHSPYTHGT